MHLPSSFGLLYNILTSIACLCLKAAISPDLLSTRLSGAPTFASNDQIGFFILDIGKYELYYAQGSRGGDLIPNLYCVHAFPKF